MIGVRFPWYTLVTNQFLQRSILHESHAIQQETKSSFPFTTASNGSRYLIYYAFVPCNIQDLGHGPVEKKETVKAIFFFPTRSRSVSVCFYGEFSLLYDPLAVISRQKFTPYSVYWCLCWLSRNLLEIWIIQLICGAIIRGNIFNAHGDALWKCSTSKWTLRLSSNLYISSLHSCRQHSPQLSHSGLRKQNPQHRSFLLWLTYVSKRQVVALLGYVRIPCTVSLQA